MSKSKSTYPQDHLNYIHARITIRLRQARVATENRNQPPILGLLPSRVEEWRRNTTGWGYRLCRLQILEHRRGNR